MSWYIKAIGERKAVRAKVEAETNLPSNVKAAILDCLQDGPNVAAGYKVEGNGHHNSGDGSYFGNISNLSCEPIPDLLLPTS
jgi:hypothetical protein